MRRSPGWTLAIVSIALFMVTLDNLVVTTALPSIRADLGASIEDLEWTVNAYTLAFAVFLLTAPRSATASGRKRMFVVGLGIFTAGERRAALAPDSTHAHRRRGVQGLGAAIVAPLTLTLLSEAFPARSAASRSASGPASPASASRSGRSSAARSSTGSPGSGSSGSTCRSASC
jgi:MFS family permease